MAKARKAHQQIEKELKAPDQFVSFWSHAGEQAGKYRRELLIGVGALIAVVAIVFVARGVLGSRAEKSTEGFAKIQQIASASLLPEAGKPAAAPDDGLTHYKTERERAEAALKEADAFLASGAGSLRKETLLLKGRLLLTLGRGAEAVTLYEGLVNDSVDPELRFLAQEGLSYAQESVGQIDKAIETVTTLAEQSKGEGKGGGFFRDRALFHKARLLEGKGAAQDAQKLYKDILAEMPTTALKEEINNRLAAVETK